MSGAGLGGGHERGGSVPGGRHQGGARRGRLEHRAGRHPLPERHHRLRHQRVAGRSLLEVATKYRDIVSGEQRGSGVLAAGGQPPVSRGPGVGAAPQPRH